MHLPPSQSPYEIHLLRFLGAREAAAASPGQAVFQIGGAGAMWQAEVLADLLPEVHADANLDDPQEAKEHACEALEAREDEERGPEGDQCQLLVAHSGGPTNAEATERAERQLWATRSWH